MVISFAILDNFGQMGVGSGAVNMLVAEFFGFLEAFLLEGNGADFAQKAQLAKAN